MAYWLITIAEVACSAHQDVTMLKYYESDDEIRGESTVIKALEAGGCRSDSGAIAGLSASRLPKVICLAGVQPPWMDDYSRIFVTPCPESPGARADDVATGTMTHATRQNPNVSFRASRTLTCGPQWIRSADQSRSALSRPHHDLHLLPALSCLVRHIIRRGTAGSAVHATFRV